MTSACEDVLFSVVHYLGLSVAFSNKQRSLMSADQRRWWEQSRFPSMPGTVFLGRTDIYKCKHLWWCWARHIFLLWCFPCPLLTQRAWYWCSGTVHVPGQSTWRGACPCFGKMMDLILRQTWAFDSLLFSLIKNRVSQERVAPMLQESLMRARLHRRRQVFLCLSRVFFRFLLCFLTI